MQVADLDMCVNICAELVEIKWARFSSCAIRHHTSVNGADKAANTVDDVSKRIGELNIVPTQPDKKLDNAHL